MTARRTRRSRSTARPPLHLAVASLIAVASLVVAACGASTGDLGTIAPPPSTQQPSLEAPSGEPTPGASMDPASAPPSDAPPSDAPGSPSPTTRPDPGTPTPTQNDETTTIRVYFFLGSFVDNEGLAPVLRVIPRTPGVGAASLRALLEGPNDAELGARPAMYTAIPEGTRLLGLRIDDGIATVDLSREFAGGGGSASVLGRLAQVVYTLTQFPSVQGVRFELDGEPVTNFTGQGVVLTEPVDRADYTDQLPAVFLDRPAWGGASRNPMRVSGLANVFEATFHVRLLDAEGRALADAMITASCGSGCWGTFDDQIPYRVSRAAWGTVQVAVFSAADGSRQVLTEYPVWLTP